MDQRYNSDEKTYELIKMFVYTIDKKPEITDSKGNTIVDFIKPLFNNESTGVADYQIMRVDAEKYQMRPDLISMAMYGDIDEAEYILKFSGISNPFSLDKDDILKIPNDQEVYGMMAVNTSDEDTTNTVDTAAEIRHNFKYYDPELNPYNKDGQSYRDLENKKIPSGIIDKGKIVNKTGNIMVPYISEDGRTAVTIRNGKVYFGEDSGLNIASSEKISQVANITSTIQNAINNTMTKLSDSNCLYNGSNLADFVRTNFNNN